MEMNRRDDLILSNQRQQKLLVLLKLCSATWVVLANQSNGMYLEFRELGLYEFME